MLNKSMKQKTMILSSIGLFTLLSFWPIILLFHFAHIEYINLAFIEAISSTFNEKIIWSYIMGSIILTIGMQILLNYFIGQKFIYFFLSSLHWLDSNFFIQYKF